MSLVDTSGNSPNAPQDFISQPYSSAAWRPGAGQTAAISKDEVMCAISTQHSPMYRIAATGRRTFNGYCYNGDSSRTVDSWTDVQTFVGCNVLFGNPGTRKRDEIIGAAPVEGAPVIEVLVPRRGSNGTLVESELAPEADVDSGMVPALPRASVNLVGHAE